MPELPPDLKVRLEGVALTLRPTVAIGGSRKLPHGQAARLLLRFLLSLEEPAILLRGPALPSSTPGPFEVEVARLCDALEITYDIIVAAPDEYGRIGREGVFARDVEMVAKADLCLAYVSIDDMEHLETSGTLHLVEKAQDQDKPVFLYMLNDIEPFSAKMIGSHDPQHAWSDKVP